MKNFLLIISYCFLVSNSFAQETKTRIELINFLEGDWLYTYGKGVWGETKSENMDFETIINLSKTPSSNDSVIYTIYVADTLFYTKMHTILELSWDKPKADWVLMKPFGTSICLV